MESSQDQEEPEGEEQQPTERSLTGRPPIILYLSFDHGAFPPFQLLVRRHIEFFEALPIDVETSVQGRPRPILLGQVGLRCIFCATLQPSIRRKFVVIHGDLSTKVWLSSRLSSTVLFLLSFCESSASCWGYMLSCKVFRDLSSGTKYCKYSLGNAMSYGAI